MRKNAWLIFFGIAFIMELTGIQLGNQYIQFVCKPLLLVLLAGYFLSQVGIGGDNAKKKLFAGLMFSWLGDVLLMFESENSIFFLLGLSAFLLAHICYILFFHAIRIRENIKGKPWLLVIVVLYYGGLIALLSPYLGEMKLPVRIYGIVISFMFMLAMHMLYIKNKTAGRYMMAGALLFVVSDSLLATNKFYRGFEGAGLLIMLSYGLAQFLITTGAIRYLRNSGS